MKTAILKILAQLLSDAKTRGKVITIVLSIAAGFLGLMCLPVMVLSSLGSSEIEPPIIDRSLFDESNFMSNLTSEQRSEIENFQNQGQEIENAMATVGLKDQTIKAQFIYCSQLENVQNFNAESYAQLFKNAENDEDLINQINLNYGTNIVYEDYLKNYTWVMNTTINPYMFSDQATKNCADLAAWAKNAYVSGWGYKDGSYGNRDDSDHIRYADNAGLMLGYLNYNAEEKSFDSDFSTLTFTEQGDLNTMPEVAGIGLFDGEKHGIYIGNGEVIFSSSSVGKVDKQAVSSGNWQSWCTYEDINYPQEVQDKINEIHAPESRESDDHRAD